MSEIIKREKEDWSFTVFLSVFMIVTYPFMRTSAPENGCTDKITQTIINKFYHNDISHLFLDIITLLFLFELEEVLGSQGMMVIFFVSLFLTSVFETALVNIYPSIKCSSGLFAVFVSVGTFDAIKSLPNSYIYMGIAVIIGIIANMIYNKNFQYLSDYIGFFVGLLLALTC